MTEVPPVLQVRNLQSYYGESHILHGVDLTVRRGELVSLLGRNGAGRSTLLKSILGMVSRRTGSIQVYDQETVQLESHKIARLGIGYCPEDRGIFSALTVEENLRLPPIVTGAGNENQLRMSEEDIFELFPNLQRKAPFRG